MKVFLDTTILVDLLTDRPPFTSEALEIFSLGEKGKVILYTSTHSIDTTHYILKKYVDGKQLRNLLSELSDRMTILDITHTILKSSLKSAHKDFEDAIQMITAESAGEIDYILTRNLKDFKTSVIPAVSIREFLAVLKSN
ncbi:MAG: putative nucleic acid-binding protein [Algoriphagus sp.]|jgi:predicted nucleic acid-binding protein